MYELGWFSTGRDPAARELFLAVQKAIGQGELRVRIAYVFCNRGPGEDPETDRFLDLVAAHGITRICLSSRGFEPELRRQGLEETKRLGRDAQPLREWRRRFDQKVIGLLSTYRVDLVVLAGYMLVASELLCRHFPMINLHPAAPGGPKGTWQEVIWQLISRQAHHTGVTMHLVTEVLDEGPPVTYCTFPIRGGGFDPLWKALEGERVAKSLEEIKREQGEAQPLFQEIRRQGVRRELPLLVQTLRAFAEGRVRIADGKVLAGDRVLEGGYDLTQEVERELYGS